MVDDGVLFFSYEVDFGRELMRGLTEGGATVFSTPIPISFFLGVEIEICFVVQPEGRRRKEREKMRDQEEIDPPMIYRKSTHVWVDLGRAC